MPKPSKRMAAKQAELSRRKRQHRLGVPGTATVQDGTEIDAEADGQVTEAAVAATAPPSGSPSTPPPAPPQPRAPQAPFRQPSFRSAARTSAAAGPREAIAAGPRRPLPFNPYQARDLRAITILSLVLLVGMIVLKVVL